MAEKPTRLPDEIEVVYPPEHWERLGLLRKRALEIVRALHAMNLDPVVHGSVARGDVDAKSDVDIILLRPVFSHIVELALNLGGFKFFSRRITQATPGHTPKAHIYLDPEERASVTFPLMNFRRLEIEFYKFGGMVGLKELEDGTRVPGCTKRLTLIQPTKEGHIESPVKGREKEVAKIIGVSVDIVRQRVLVLSRRDEVGRTGVFVNLLMDDDETFEEALRRLMETKPALRRRFIRS
ncbi:nucleotidyltransferase domain-containing protein [Candidatus Bathyarchaeota archaeon]|nr:nucleotidyltransferase domain-containing protein [Candidatus Bathyarchaeota archaeon]MBS7627348.1 nucleotidyltransferase domain-containing protein [Candidatus Bathyarchaeota archaeon]